MCAFVEGSMVQGCGGKSKSKVEESGEDGLSVCSGFSWAYPPV